MALFKIEFDTPALNNMIYILVIFSLINNKFIAVVVPILEAIMLNKLLNWKSIESGPKR